MIKNNSFQNHQGITLIALIITIIVLLILTGVTLSFMIGEQNTLGRASRAKNKSEYAAAKEIILLKLTEVKLECTEEEKVFNLVSIARNIKEDKEITIQKYYNKTLASLKSEITENLENLIGIVVSVDVYSPYKFLIAEKEGEYQIIGVTVEEVTDTFEMEEFETLPEFESKIPEDVEQGANSAPETEEEIEIPNGEIPDISNPIEITTYLAIKTNTKNTLNLTNVENAIYHVTKMTPNLQLSTNILTANRNADSADSCQIDIQGMYQGQTYLNHLTIYVEPKDTKKIGEEWYWQIRKAQDLVRLRELVNHEVGSLKNAVMMNDIDLGEIENFEPIGYYINDEDYIPFKGIFDGQNWKIRNMKILSDEEYGTGLFGIVEEGTVKNLKFENPDINSQGAFSGIVVGDLGYNSLIENVQVLDGRITGTSYMGGICGAILEVENNYSIIRNCLNNAEIEGYGIHIGGICGYNCNNSTIEQCTNKGLIKGTGMRIAGIAGTNLANGTIKNCYNIGTIQAMEAQQCYAGIVGCNVNATVEKCYNVGEIQGKGASIGGIVGWNGVNTEGGEFRYCYNLGEVFNEGSGKFTGGISGGTYAFIENCYNVGNVSSKAQFIGGILGGGSKGIKSCYQLDTVTVNLNNSPVTRLYGGAGNYYGKLTGEGSATDCGLLMQEQMPTVYDVMNEFSEIDSKIWSNTNPNEPKLFWEK